MSELRILCAVRGGPQSRHTVDRAVELAQERGAHLIFLYIVDAEFLGYATVGRPSVVLKELRTTGEFMMHILKEEVGRRGVDADCVVRTGDARRQIIESLRWQDADILVMGRPVKSPGADMFTEESLARFIERVRAKTGIEVVVAGTPATSSESDT